MSSDHTDPLATIQQNHEAGLRAVLLAEGPVVALDAEKAVAELTYTATALRQVLATNQPPDLDLTPEFVATWFSDQLTKEATNVARNAVGRAAHTRSLAQDQWKAVIERERLLRRRAGV